GVLPEIQGDNVHIERNSDSSPIFGPQVCVASHKSVKNGVVMDSKELLEIADEFLVEAVKSYEKELFRSTTNENVREYINSIQSIRESTKNMINMKRILPFLTGMEHFEKVLLALKFEHVAKIMASVWGPLLFLLKKIYKPTWKALVVAIDQLTGALERHQEFIQASGSSFHNPQADLELDPSLMMGDFFLVSSPDSERVNSMFSDYVYGLKRYRDNSEEREKLRRDKTKKSVLAWISASKKTDSLHKKFQDMRICSDTGRWLFKRYSEVSDWIKEDPPPESAIWLQGSRGFGNSHLPEGTRHDLTQASGKTILTSLLIDELGELRTEKKRFAIPPESKIYYFYCQEEDPEHRTYLNILRGILHQMVDSNEDLLPYCLDKAESSGNPSLADTETAQSLIEAFFEYNTRQYVIIDGIDECEATEARRVAKFFMEQVTKCDNDIKQGRLRLLFMSQPNPDLARAKVMPEDGACVPLKGTDNAEDIRSYVKKRIVDFSEARATRSGFNLSENDKDQIESKMFLYAHLAIEYLLQQPTKEKLKEKMKEEMAPKELSQIYEKLLGNVQTELLSLTEGQAHWDMAKLLLGWLVCAKRPLKWHEMQSILSYDPDQQKVDFDNKMLRQDANNHIIQNEYINAQAVYCELAVLCLRYMCLVSDSRSYSDNERKDKVKLGWFSFQDYACSQWHSHISTVIELCGDFFHGSNQSHAQMFGSALQDFMNKHAAELTRDRHRDLLPQMPQQVTRFSGLFFYDNLCNLWNHIYTHQKDTYDIRNTVGIARIDEALVKNRDALETLTPDMKAYQDDTIEDYYGPNLFKCKRLLCRFFHVGYDKKDDREAHNSRHERPYQCDENCNAAPIGFSTKKDKERHMRFYHPRWTNEQSVFEPMRSRTGSRSFKCSLCDKEFTRKLTQLGHERSHFGEKPYKCSICDKGFARLNDCNRHQRQVHANRAAR
ncbi:hypothetical protein MKX07_002911, partial [Trichoderma sp. CBMAI-0711]